MARAHRTKPTPDTHYFAQHTIFTYTHVHSSMKFENRPLVVLQACFAGDSANKYGHKMKFACATHTILSLSLERRRFFAPLLHFLTMWHHESSNSRDFHVQSSNQAALSNAGA